MSEERTFIGEKEFEGMNGIFITEHEMSNMKVERIVVSNPAILAILKVTLLSPEAQEQAIYDLVDRTPEWDDLDVEVQVAKMKAILTQETIIEYLKAKEVIRAKCDLVETGIDEEGSVVIEAFYVSLNREQRRMMDKVIPKEEKQQMREAVNILSGNDNLVDLAAKRLEKLKEEGKVYKFRGAKSKMPVPPSAKK